MLEKYTRHPGNRWFYEQPVEETFSRKSPSNERDFTTHTAKLASKGVRGVRDSVSVILSLFDTTTGISSSLMGVISKTFKRGCCDATFCFFSCAVLLFSDVFGKLSIWLIDMRWAGNGPNVSFQYLYMWYEVYTILQYRKSIRIHSKQVAVKRNACNSCNQYDIQWRSVSKESNTHFLRFLKTKILI